MDYAYTIQGWIKGVNSNTLVGSRDIGKDGDATSAINAKVPVDAFGYSLNYFSGDYPTGRRLPPTRIKTTALVVRVPLRPKTHQRPLMDVQEQPGLR